MSKDYRNIGKFWPLNSLVLCLVTISASAQIYKLVDETGAVTFSDVPPAAGSGNKSSVVKPNVTSSMPGLSPGVSSSEAAPTDKAAARTVSIASSLNNATIPMGAGIFDVTAELRAPLGDGEFLALYLDGETVGVPQTSDIWTVTYVIRGPHTLQLRHLSSAGETLRQSEKITVFVLRPSTLRATRR